jgi:phosphatidylglycerophosphate synthase
VKRYIPFALTSLRLMLGPSALVCAFKNTPRIVYLAILLVGIASDIFDGILARRFGVSTAQLRRYDSVTDAVYYSFILVVAWILCRPVVLASMPAIAVLIFSEAAVIVVSAARFRRYPATHTYLAKFYGLCMLAVLIALLVFDASSWVVWALAIVAVVTNAEIILIHFLADSPPVDVRSVVALRR